MPKTFTLPEHLENQIAALTSTEPCELMYQSELLNELSEQLEEVNFSPKQSTIETVLAYSKAVEVRESKTMIDKHVMVLN